MRYLFSSFYVSLEDGREPRMPLPLPSHQVYFYLSEELPKLAQLFCFSPMANGWRWFSFNKHYYYKQIIGCNGYTSLVVK